MTSPSSTTDPQAPAIAADVRYTSCRWPATTDLAELAGDLERVATDRGLVFRSLRDFLPEAAEDHHQLHDVELFREGGNIPPLWTRARGAQTRLIGLFWLEEGQFIAAAPGSNIITPADLAGRRVAVPAAREREPQLQRPVALRGFEGVLNSAGLRLDDVQVVEVDSGEVDVSRFWKPQMSVLDLPEPSLEAVAEGRADVAYGVGPWGLVQAERYGLERVIEIDRLPSLVDRVNLGTPRAISVHAVTLRDRFDLVVDYLAALIRASDWADEHPEALIAGVQRRLDIDDAVISRIFGGLPPRTLRPRLDREIVDLYKLQHDFLLRNDFIAAPVDFDAWVAPEPLVAALERVQDTPEAARPISAVGVRT